MIEVEADDDAGGFVAVGLAQMDVMSEVMNGSIIDELSSVVQWWFMVVVVVRR
ncbi:hypothetical protein Hanom_Chr06g00486341 [Helianthus anomalus]